MDEKLFKKLSKVLGEDYINEARALGADQLEGMIVSAAQEVEAAKAELEANPKYQELKATKQAVESGFKEAKKYNTAKSLLAVALLAGRGTKVAVGE